MHRYYLNECHLNNPNLPSPQNINLKKSELTAIK